MPKTKAKQKRTAKVQTGPEYAWKDNSRFAVPAQVAGEELARIASEAAAPLEHLTPRVVVEESRPDEAPLHPCFEWNDDRAAELYREEQARGVIRSLRRIEPEADPEADPPKSIFYAHARVPDVGPCYVPMSRVLNDDDLRQQVLRDAMSLLKGVRERYRHLTELQEVFQAIDRLDEAE